MLAFALSTPLFPPPRPFAAISARRPTFRATLSPTRATLNHTSLNASNPMESLSATDQARIAAVRTQMEFWFSASNLKRDWYLRRQMDDEGWLDPSVFLLFNRIKTLKATLDDIILACRTSAELEVSVPPSDSFGDAAAQTRVRRNPELPDFREDDDEVSRSFIVSGLPEEASIEWVQQAFQRIGAEPVYVKLYKKNVEDVRAFVCFESDQVADKVGQLGVEGLDLKRRGEKKGVMVCEVTGLGGGMDWRMVYKSVTSMFGGIKYLMYGTGELKCFVTVGDNVRERVVELEREGAKVGEEDWKVRVLEGAELEAYWKRAEQAGKEKKEKKVERDGAALERHPTGVIVKIEGIGEHVTWRDIRADLGGVGRVIYLNYVGGSGECFARFGSPEEAAGVVEALGGEDPVLVCGEVVQARVLEGDEEVQYWERAEEIRRKRKEAEE